MAAAYLKYVDLRKEVAAIGHRLPAHWATAVLIQWELVLANLMLFDSRRRRTFITAVVTFLSFLVYNVVLVVNGASSCGCFGDVRLYPGLLAAVDVFILVLLVGVLRGHVSPTIARNVKWRLELYKVGRVVSAMACVLAVLYLGHALMTRVDGASGDNGIVPLGNGIEHWSPAKWKGSQFPFLDRLSPTGALTHGRQTLLLVRSSCHHCRSLVENLVAANWHHGDEHINPAQFKCLDLDSHPTDSSWQILGAYPDAIVRLPSAGSILTPVPAIITCQDGVVIEYRTLLP